MPTKRKPTYLLHRPSGQARVRIDGRDLYLGPYRSPESRARYDEVIRAWLARQDPRRVILSVDDLALAFLDYAEGYYRHPDGTSSGEARNMRHALAPLVRLFGTTLVRDFGPLRLKAVREEMIRSGWCRTNVNREVHRVKRLFAWGVENEMVPPEIYQGLRAVAALRAGRTEARESEPVQPVEETVVEATLPHLTSVLQAMVRLQLLCGMRPAEVCLIRPCDVSMRTDGIWTYRPARHKTQHHGKDRVIFIGPAGQEVLRTFLERPAESYCFSPAESEAERNAQRRRNRRSPMTPSQRARKPVGRPFADRYDKDSYGKAIRRACLHRLPTELRTPRSRKKKEPATIREARLQKLAAWKAESVWSPNRLRHLRATMVRERFGLEVASSVLGHSGLKVTEIYAQRSEKAAAEAMREIG